MNFLRLISLVIILIPLHGISQKKDVFLDKKGVMKWGDSKKEVMGFGVNYTVPFAHAYRSAKLLDIDPKEAIDNDVYHFSRLGFDLYRVHVWDTEISDTLGNLLDNIHLELFDYLLFKLDEYNINYVITPIAFWGNGWPEPDEPTPGFAYKYGKEDCLTNPEAIKAQENYLFQFINHVNQYTGTAYKNDPRAIAFEISNEPHHGGEASSVKKYIERMVKAVKRTGTRKPVFYNVSHSIQYAETYFDSGIDGGTFQWYPTGLTYQRELSGNLLPNVDRYNIPFDDIIKKNKAAKLVYEFDAADVGRTYIYPAMARSFREAGIQIATHFSYDPTFLAYANTEYNTHYMNLTYTPGKALSLMISGKVFHEMPLYKSYGRYPINTEFGNVKVSYEGDLAEYYNGDTYIYTNNTNRVISQPETLEHIAGVGNSEIVKYEGSGAYFIDNIKEGIWRLEVMPDVVWVNNPFGRNSRNRKVSEIKWGMNSMNFTAPDLGSSYSIKGINKGNDYKAQATEGVFQISPGTYLLYSGEMDVDPDSQYGNIKMNQFYAPKSTLDKTYVVHKMSKEATAGTDQVIEAEVISSDEIEEVTVVMFQGWNREVISLERVSSTRYQGTIPGKSVNPGTLTYNIVVRTNKESINFPGEVAGSPQDWDYYNPENFSIKVVSDTNPLYLFDAHKDSELLIRRWVRGINQVPLAEPARSEFRVNLENLNNEHGQYSFQHSLIKDLKGRITEIPKKSKLIIHAKSLNDKPCKLRVGFVLSDGSTYANTIELLPKKGEYSIDLNTLKLVKTTTLPRPYPTFMDYHTLSVYGDSYDLSKAESLIFTIGPGTPESKLDEPHGVAIESVRVQ